MSQTKSQLIDGKNPVGLNAVDYDFPAADGTTGQLLSTDGSGTLSWTSISTAVPDADYGDITVSSSGLTWTIDDGVVSYAKMQDVSATDKLLGRSTAGAGDVEEITCTAAGRALLDDASASAQRTTLGLVIGTNVQAYDADTAKTDVIQTFSAAQTFSADVTLNAQSDLRFADADSSNWVAFQAPATVTSNVTWTLPSADGSSGQVLSTNGSGTLSWATAGGGGLTYFTEAESTAAPNNVVSVDSLTAAASTANADIALVPKVGGALLAAIPDSTATGGNKRGVYATDWQRERGNALDVAGSSYSTISGGSYNRITTSGFYSAIPGGYDNECTTDYAFAGGRTSDGDGPYSFAYGYNVNAIGQYSVGLGQSAYAGGNSSAAIGGYAASADGQYSAILGSYIGYALANYSIVLGGSRGYTGTVVGRCVIPASNSPVASKEYCSQSSILICGRQTTDATTTSLGSDATTVDSNNILTLTNNSAFYVRGSCIAGVTGAGDTKAWTFEAVIKRGASAATTTLVGSVVKNVVAQDSGAAAWDINIVADTSFGGIRVEVTGAASTTIRWVTKFESTETAY